MSNEFLIFLVGAVVVFVYFIMSQGQNTKPQNKGIKLTKEEERNYQYYLSKFDHWNHSKKLSPMLTYVAGVRYKNEDTQTERQAIIKKTKVGEKIMLLPDELNKFDKDAIKVVRLNGEQIGFLNTDLAIEIKARLLQRLRVDAIIKEINDDNGMKEVVLELVKYSRKVTQ
jgi:hypothetical protein